MNETAFDMQAEAEIAWWRDAHDLAESRRLRLVEAMEKALAELNQAWDEESFERAWARFQKARQILKKELK